MAHRHRFEKPGDARYLTFSCYQRLPLLSNDRIKDRFLEHVVRAREECRFDLVAWVVMPEHVHLLVIPRHEHADVPRLLRVIKQPFAKEVLARWRELDAPVLERLVDTRGQIHFWQRGGGYDRTITSECEWFEKIRYINENPVRRGLVASTLDYAWSSARALAHDDRALPIRPDLGRRFR